MSMPDEKNIHAGHRSRMMERFYRSGFDGWQQHEIVEVLLFQSLPRINTNVHGHRLINAFGSLKNLLEGSRCEIESVYGIGPASAAYISGIRGDVSEYIREQYRGADDINIYQLAFLVDWFMRDDENPIGMIVFDENGGFEDFVCLPLKREGDTVDAAAMFASAVNDLTNRTFSLFMKPQHRLTEDDVSEIRKYTFARSIILDEVFLMNRREPVPTLHPNNPPKRVYKNNNSKEKEH